MNWGRPQVRELEAMADFGLSFADAAHFLGVTRNAVAGAAHRHGVQFACEAGNTAAIRETEAQERRAAWLKRKAA